MIDDLFNPPAAIAFDGKTYESQRDHGRLKGQIGRVWELMADGRWRTLGSIATSVGGSEAAVSARLRDFRKPKYGSHAVDRRYVCDGLFEYRLVVKV